MYSNSFTCVCFSKWVFWVINLSLLSDESQKNCGAPLSPSARCTHPNSCTGAPSRCTCLQVVFVQLSQQLPHWNWDIFYKKINVTRILIPGYEIRGYGWQGVKVFFDDVWFRVKLCEIVHRSPDGLWNPKKNLKLITDWLKLVNAPYGVTATIMNDACTTNRSWT